MCAAIRIVHHTLVIEELHERWIPGEMRHEAQFDIRVVDAEEEVARRGDEAVAHGESAREGAATRRDGGNGGRDGWDWAC